MSLDVYQRLLAMEQGRAVPCATTRHRHLAAKPFVVTGYHLAGEPSAVVALRYGTTRHSPRLLTVTEPRDRDQRFKALGEFARDLALYFGRFTATEPVVRASGKGGRDALEVGVCAVDAPQLVVPNEATARWLTQLLGRYLRTLPVEEGQQSDPALRTAGTYLSWFGSRRQLPGSTVVLTATDLLTTHWRTGQLPTEDGHLGRLLAWVEPPAVGDVWQAAQDAELRPPAGPASDPAWDEHVLRPAMTAAQEEGSRRPAALRALRLIADEALAHAWRDTWHAFDLVTLLPEGAHVPQRWESDRWSWTRHRERVAEGTAVFAARLADVPAYRYLHELETRTVALERQMALDDPLVMARYLASGEAFAATVVKTDPDHRITGAKGRELIRPLLWVRPDTAFDRPVGAELWVGRLGVTVRALDGDTVELMVVKGAGSKNKLDRLPDTETSVVLSPFGPEQRFPDNLPDELPWPARSLSLDPEERP